ncbi:MAG: transaldolase [Candidatus Omnitrophota bacterium]
MESVETKSKIKQLCEFGQSVWLDNISRSLIDSGEFSRLIELGVTGVTSNPTIFDKAISGSPDYDRMIKDCKIKGLNTFEIYDELTVKDIQDTADLFQPIFQETRGGDGYISLEVNPLLAHKTEETVREAERLYKKVNRQNVMFKIPATENGFSAGRILLAKGINVNFTLVFSLNQYVNTVDAFLKGAEEFLKSGGDLNNIASVASVFVSRIDISVDKLLEENRGDVNLKGRAAVANSKLIFAKYVELFSDEKFLKLESKGLRKQRALWASTSTKNPNYNDIKYVTELIGKETINTMPPSTIEAFLNHGIIESTLSPDTSEAKKVINALEKFNIDIISVCDKLLKYGIVAFENSFASLLKSIELKRNSL